MTRLFSISLFLFIFIWLYGFLLTEEESNSQNQKKIYKALPKVPEKPSPMVPFEKIKVSPDSLTRDSLNISDTLIHQDSIESNNHQIPKPPFHKFYRFMYIHRKSPIGLLHLEIPNQFVFTEPKNFS